MGLCDDGDFASILDSPKMACRYCRSPWPEWRHDLYVYIANLCLVGRWARLIAMA